MVFKQNLDGYIIELLLKSICKNSSLYNLAQAVVLFFKSRIKDYIEDIKYNKRLYIKIKSLNIFIINK